ncbi:MAG: molybdate ABC transporter substrate-binding protein [Gammaproteobacteria bacterium]|nr:molybdate ABC transporter substrate-binding protein [Gammaproteobacteria bacterium]
MKSKLLLALLTLVICPALYAAEGSPPVVTVFAAVSLTDVLQDASAEFTRRTGIEVRHSFASSAQLARQIESGARADVFVSADQKWMDELRNAGQVDSQSERHVARNRLVVIQPVSTPRIDRHNWLSVVERGGLVTGDPEYVPLGRYAREALTSLGVWDKIETRIARAENSRVATLLVARAEAVIGIVYATDALVAPGVRVVMPLDASLHSPVVYPAARTRDARATASVYLDFLSSKNGQKFFARHGFQ